MHWRYLKKNRSQQTDRKLKFSDRHLSPSQTSQKSSHSQNQRIGLSPPYQIHLHQTVVYFEKTGRKKY